MAFTREKDVKKRAFRLGDTKKRKRKKNWRKLEKKNLGRKKNTEKTQSFAKVTHWREKKRCHWKTRRNGKTIVEGEIEWEITSLTEFSGYTQFLNWGKLKHLCLLILWVCNKDPL